MADVHNSETRSRNMAAIKSGDTKPEIMIRSGLHARGFRFRLHDKKLPGRPDLVLQKHRAVVFVNGCFWHGHDCPLFRWPKSREDFWRTKIRGNVERDHKNLDALRSEGWRTAIVWGCAIAGRDRLVPNELLDQLSQWLVHGEDFCTIRGSDQETASTRA